MEFADFFKGATSSIAIVGTNPLIPHLARSARFLTDLLVHNKNLEIQILCESDTENFNQSLCTDTESSKRRLSLATLNVHRDRIMGPPRKNGLMEEIRNITRRDSRQEQIISRIQVKQINLRLPVNIIRADDRMWCCIITDSAATPDSYFTLEHHVQLKRDLIEFIDFYLNRDKGGVYLSEPHEELIELYDKNGVPRGIFPRACFNTTKFVRHSVWGFVFNRKGELLLHQRGENAKDGAGLWDKSIGGHVDLRDSSTSITAARELIEELFLPRGEDTKCIQPNIEDIVDFGVWNKSKRPERSFGKAFAGLLDSDWIMFRTIGNRGESFVENRVSLRRMREACGKVRTERAMFNSDMYLFIAPRGSLDTKSQMRDFLQAAKRSGTAKDHRLIAIEDLRQWIVDEYRRGTAEDTFTDDILFVNDTHSELLESFSAFVQFIFSEHQE